MGCAIIPRLAIQGDRAAHEHDRARQGVCRIAAGIGAAVVVGVAAVSAVWQHGHMETWLLRASCMVPERASGGPGAAASLFEL